MIEDPEFQAQKRRIEAFARLGRVEEEELARRSAGGDRAARDRLVEANLWLVVSIAKDYSGRGLSKMELFQEGAAALTVAADRFDPTRGTRLSTFALPRVRGAIVRAVAEKQRHIRIPADVLARRRRVDASRTRLSKRRRRKATRAEIARDTGLTEQQVAELEALPVAEVRQLPEDEPPDEDPRGERASRRRRYQVSPAETLIRSERYSFDEVNALVTGYFSLIEHEHVSTRSLARAPRRRRKGKRTRPTFRFRLADLERALRRLPESEYEVVYCRLFGLTGVDTARELGIHRNTVRKRYKQAIAWLVAYLNGDPTPFGQSAKLRRGRMRDELLVEE